MESIGAMWTVAAIKHSMIPHSIILLRYLSNKLIENVGHHHTKLRVDQLSALQGLYATSGR